MKILVYGLGRYTERIVDLIRKEHDVIAYSDSYSAIQSYGKKKFVRPKEIKHTDFDYIIVTVVDRKQALKIRDNLTSQYLIPLRKIIPFLYTVTRQI